MRKRKTQNSGFTLIELLVVIGILGILMAITIVAVNPGKQFQSARNAQRQADVNTILNAIYEYEASNSGAAPASLTSFQHTTAKSLGALPNQVATGTSFADPNLTFTGLSGNIINDASVTVTGCSETADNGTWPVVSGTGTTLVVANAGASAVSATGCTISGWRIDLCSELAPTYIAALPTDPTGATGTLCAATYNTGYMIAVNAAGNRYTVSAPSAENGATISVTR
jgi:prepilin-type N-terminal cleavage/methylation domain-containing protein